MIISNHSTPLQITSTTHHNSLEISFENSYRAINFLRLGVRTPWEDFFVLILRIISAKRCDREGLPFDRYVDILEVLTQRNKIRFIVRISRHQHISKPHWLSRDSRYAAIASVFTLLIPVSFLCLPSSYALYQEGVNQFRHKAFYIIIQMRAICVQRRLDVLLVQGFGKASIIPWLNGRLATGKLLRRQPNRNMLFVFLPASKVRWHSFLFRHSNFECRIMAIETSARAALGKNHQTDSGTFMRSKRFQGMNL